MPRSVSAVANLFIDVLPADGKKLRRKNVYFVRNVSQQMALGWKAMLRDVGSLRMKRERDVYLRKHCGDIEDVGADEVTEDDDDDVEIEEMAGPNRSSKRSHESD